jgi:hypothetical protein
MYSLVRHLFVKKKRPPPYGEDHFFGRPNNNRIQTRCEDTIRLHECCLELAQRLAEAIAADDLPFPSLLLQLLREFRVPSHNPLSAAEQEEQFSHVLQPEAGFVGIDLPSKLPVVIGQERLDLLQGRLRRPKVGVMHVKAITDRQGCRRATAEPPSGRALA